MVAADTIGNTTRPPNRSASAPTGIRPREPTTTGTATSSDCSNDDRSRPSLNRGPSGLSSAQAQKLTAKPTAARASVSQARPGIGASEAALSLYAIEAWTMLSASSLLRGSVTWSSR